MNLTERQIARIQRDVKASGITVADIGESIVDHICCAIESSGHTNFEDAYADILARFGPQGIHEIQTETIRLLNAKKEEAMKKTMYVLGYVAAFLSTTGLLFKLQHWPGAAIMLTLGIALLNFGFLPMYFYDRYKRAAE